MDNGKDKIRYRINLRHIIKYGEEMKGFVQPFPTYNKPATEGFKNM